MHFIHRHFKVPSCNVDLTRKHSHPCLEYHIHRCLGPCVEGLTTDEEYAAAVREVRLFLEGRHKDLARELRGRVETLSTEMRYEEASALHDLLHTVEEMGERQKMAQVEGNDTDIFAYYAEPPLVALNLFHLRGGHIVDRREFFWEDQPEFDPEEFFSSLLKQVYLNDPLYSRLHPRARGVRRSRCAGRISHRSAAATKWKFTRRSAARRRAMIDLVESNAKHSFEQRFRVMKPSSKAIRSRAAGHAGPRKRSQSHRMLRYFPHSGHR